MEFNRFSILLQIVVAMGISGIHTNLRAVEARADNGVEIGPKLERSINENLLLVNGALSNVVCSLMDGVKHLKDYYDRGSQWIRKMNQHFGSLDKIANITIKQIGNPQDVDGIDRNPQAISAVNLQPIADRMLAITKEIAGKGVAPRVSNDEYWSDYNKVYHSCDLFFIISKYKEMTKQFEESKKQVRDMKSVVQAVKQIYRESPDMDHRIINFCSTHHCNDLYHPMQEIINQLLIHSPAPYSHSFLSQYRKELNKTISVFHDEAKKINIYIPHNINQWPNADMLEHFEHVHRLSPFWSNTKYDSHGYYVDKNNKKYWSYETVLKTKTYSLEDRA